MSLLSLTASVANSPTKVGDGIRQGLHLVFSGNEVIVRTTLRTLRLAVTATTIATVVGIPCGCLVGLGRSASSRVVLALANAFTRLPPVGAGVFVFLLLQRDTVYGDGPLGFLDWNGTLAAGYLAQTLLAVPIVIALTASAVQGVPSGLLQQARAYGASRSARSVLALREARRAVIAAILVAMGVTITSIGALIAANVGNGARVDGRYEPTTLAVGALSSLTGDLQPGASLAQTKYLGTPGADLAVAYGTVLLGLFVLIAALLTWLQEQRRTSWIAGGIS